MFIILCLRRGDRCRLLTHRGKPDIGIHTYGATYLLFHIESIERNECLVVSLLICCKPYLADCAIHLKKLTKNVEVKL